MNISEPVVGGTIGFILLIIVVVLICCIAAPVIRKNRKKQSCNTQQIVYEIPTVNTLQSSGSSQPNTSATSNSFGRLPTHNLVMQTSRQETYNGDTPCNIEDNPSYQLGGAVHGGWQPNYYNVGSTSFK